MIVAMLLGPITGVALALVESNISLLRGAVLALLAGIAIVMVTAFIIGMIHHRIPITGEIIARTAPNLLDLMIALAGGAAGAFATVSPRLSISLVGVAIATALVPPLAAASILFGRGQYQLGLGAFELAFTNMVAIEFAASFVLWLNGFNEFTRERELNWGGFLRRHLVSIATLAVLAVILTGNLRGLISEQVFEDSVSNILRQEIGKLAGFNLAEVRFEATETSTIVRALVRSPNPPTAQDVAKLESKLPASPGGTPIELRIRYVETLILNRSGPILSNRESRNEE